MECPNCNFELNSEKICPNCGIDVISIKKILNISNRLYNKALECAAINDLTGAEESLTKSILFNKRNINARNLLGLIYLETGRTADAIKQWIISTNFQKDDNLASEYMQHFQNNMKEYDSFNDSIKMYNQALKYVKQKSDDMAVIQLKKAVDLNPKFIEAMNLLVLCYISQGESKKASDVIKKILALDVNNRKALYYFQELFPNEKRPDVNVPKPIKTGIKEVPYVSHDISRSTKKSGNSGFKFMDAVIFIVGCICSAVVMTILVIPAMVEQKQGEIDTLNSNIVSLKQDYDKLKNDSSSEIDKLINSNKELQLQVEEYNKKAELDIKLKSIDEASDYYSNGDSISSAAILLNLNISGLPADTLEEVNNLKAKVFPKAASSLLSQGKTAFNNKKYEDAKKYLNNGITYSADSLDTKYSCIYYLGRVALAEGNNVKAKEYFTQVSENHPNATMKKYAKNYLSGL